MTKTKNTTLFSGIQPTGEIHIGNYLGALKNWVALQDKYQAIYCIVDLHALTIAQDPKEFRNKIRQTAIDLLAIGLDPKCAIFFVQSQVPAHTELAWLFNTLIPVSELERMTQYKDKARQNKQNINAGLLTYPALMAADILLYEAAVVPVGDDQLQHIELTNVIARKFNNQLGKTFAPVKPLLTSGARIMSLTEPDKKMSKSRGSKNYIALRDKPEIIKQKISRAVTDTGPIIAGKKSLGVHNLFELLGLFANATAVNKYEKQYQQGTIKYAELKNDLAEAIIKNLEPIQKKIAYWEKNKSKVDKILERGAKQANKIAQDNMVKFKKKFGLL
ncbi:MAG: tryptophan--tRNA ligase [Candidatus Komeilibacteria bacterium]